MPMRGITQVIEREPTLAVVKTEKHLKKLKRAILGIAMLVSAVPCLADGFVNVYEIPSSVSINVISNMLYHENLNKTLHHWDNYEKEQKEKKAKAAAARTALPLAQPTGVGISALVQNLPKDQADRGRAAYKQAFDYHEQVIRKFGLPSGDLGVAFASCIAGAWIAYNNKPFPDEFYLPLVEQMRQIVSSKGDALQSASAAERSSTYESLAVAGMIMASSQITWQRNPRAAGADELRDRMRVQGGETLTRMLQVPPERVGIGAAGVYALAGDGRR